MRTGIDARSPSRTKARNLSVVRVLVITLMWALGAAVFFRQPVWSGFRDISGDVGDARLVVYLHEHWLQVAAGQSSWSAPEFFTPAADTLGYSDTFLIDEIFFAPLRLAGMDIFLAYQWTLILLSLVGFVGSFALFRSVLGDRWFVAAELAAVFTFSNMMFLQVGHSQLCAVYWLPILILLLRSAREAARRRILFAASAGLLWGLLFFSTYYVAWFFTIAAVLWIVVFVVISGRYRARLSTLGPAWRRYRVQLAAGLGGSLIGLVPFAIIYLPTLSFGARSYADTISAGIRDVVNTGQHNYFWGSATGWLLHHAGRLTNGELGFGLTPVLLLTLVGGLIYFAHRVWTTKGQLVSDRIALTTAAVTVATMVLPMRVHGISAWLLIWDLVPGAHAIRAIDRMAVLSGLLAPLVVAFLVADLSRRTRERSAGAIAGRQRSVVRMCAPVLLVGVLTTEQLNAGVNSQIDRPAQLAQLSAAPTPPSTCRAFYITVSGVRPPPAFVSDIDAMLISQLRRIPTINGYSGQTPPGFGAADSPGDRDYPAAVAAWITKNQLDGICSYDNPTHTWTTDRTTAG